MSFMALSTNLVPRHMNSIFVPNIRPSTLMSLVTRIAHVYVCCVVIKRVTAPKQWHGISVVRDTISNSQLAR
jgi:hypothetical protein